LPFRIGEADVFGGKRRLEGEAFRKTTLHWHDLRHEALSRLADEGVPVHELQLLVAHANITTTQLARHDDEQVEVG
jgi:integrase